MVVGFPFMEAFKQRLEGQLSHLSFCRIFLSSSASAKPGLSRSSCFFTVSNMFTSIMSKTRGFPYLEETGEGKSLPLA